MNNIYLNNIDPVLANSSRSISYQDQFIQPPQFIQTQNPIKDYISILDDKLSSLTSGELEALSKDEMFVSLNGEFNKVVQKELLNIIKGRLNSNQTIIDNVNQQIEMISKVSNSIKDKERQNLDLMNDYMTNFSHLTFQEYINMKNKAANIKQSEQEIETITNTGKSKKFE
jgi:hypothetical protein